MVHNIWTWTALEADTKLIVSFFVGDRDGDCAKRFMDDVAARLANRVQLTSDGHKAYLDAVEDAFGANVDYAQLVKLFGASPDSTKGRYSPAECTGIKKTKIEGKPDPKHISTGRTLCYRSNRNSKPHRCGLLRLSQQRFSFYERRDR